MANLPDEINQQIRFAVKKKGGPIQQVIVGGRIWWRWCHCTPRVRVKVFFGDGISEKVERGKDRQVCPICFNVKV